MLKHYAVKCCVLMFKILRIEIWCVLMLKTLRSEMLCINVKNTTQ